MKALMESVVVLFGLASLFNSVKAGDTRIMGESMESDPIDSESC